MPRIDTVDSRTKLKPRHEPYWQRMSTGCYLGFRKLTPTSTGTWIAAYRDADTNKRTKHSLGKFDDQPASQRFDAAKKAAEAWYSHLGRGGSPEVLNVRGACDRWINHKRNLKGDKTADEALARLKRWVYLSKIANLSLNKLTRNHLDVWRAEMSNSVVVINPYAEEKRTRKRAEATVNRDISELRAALNFAHDNNWVTDDSAWRVSLRPSKNSDRRRDAYLDRDQRVKLIAGAETDFANFLTGLSLIPLRPGALAHLVVQNFDSRLGVLTVGKDKQGQDRKIKLPESIFHLLSTLCKDRPSNEPIFTRKDGKPWDRHTWKKLFREIARDTGLPEQISLYALRHSGITDLVTSGLDLLTTALISGTSVAMIEKHYGHLRQEHASSHLEKLAL